MSLPVNYDFDVSNFVSDDVSVNISVNDGIIYRVNVTIFRSGISNLAKDVIASVVGFADTYENAISKAKDLANLYGRVI